MGSVRTRRQTRELRDFSEEPNGSANGTPSKAPKASKASKANGSAAKDSEIEARSVVDTPALDVETSDTQENIFLFWPNIIGYIRIILATGSLYYMPLHPRTCSLLYSISCLLDALDGIAARHFEQSTRFGAVLDMVTDRCTTTCLLVFLSAAWPRFSIIFQGLISLDLASHYMHMYATLTMAGQGESHKKVDAKRSWLLHLYYTNKNVLFTACAMNELFFIALYLLSFSSPMLSPSLLQPIPGAEPQAVSAQPGSPANPSWRQLFPDPYSAGALEMARANKMDSGFPWALALISLPFWAFKQWTNVVQLYNASAWLAEGDIANRKAQGLPRKKKI